MKLLIVAVGQRVPDWAQTAWDDYAKRFPPELKVELKAVKTEPRSSKTYENLVAAERQRIEAVIPRGTRIVVLDERGTALRTTALAQRLKDWQLGGDDVALIIGGPDGLEPAFRDAAH
jgi:23S rRNA (pseudouridine1915-N3)-methyltransferase